jgi:hypothetical protein
MWSCQTVFAKSGILPFSLGRPRILGLRCFLLFSIRRMSLTTLSGRAAVLVLCRVFGVSISSSVHALVDVERGVPDVAPSIADAKRGCSFADPSVGTLEAVATRGACIAALDFSTGTGGMPRGMSYRLSPVFTPEVLSNAKALAHFSPT